jgi:glycosyltransferase involved in cell wall biosynthesis
MYTFAFDAKRLFQNATGLGNYSRTVVAQLAAQYPQHQYQLYTPKLMGNTQLFLPDAPCFQIRSPKKGAVAWLWRSFGLTNDLMANKPDLFHGLSHEIPLNLPKKGIPTVVTIHDLIFQIYPHTFSWFDRQVFALKWKHSIAHADRVIAISHATARDISERYQIGTDRLKVVYQSCHDVYYGELPLGSELIAFKAKHQLPDQFLLSVGSVIERKNLLAVIQALAAMSPSDRPFLVIVGHGGYYMEKVKACIAANRLDASIRFWEQPQISVKDLRLLYASASASIYISLYEGFGLPIVESLLSGTPVITSGLSSMPEAGGPGGLYVNPKNRDEVKNSIERLMSNTELRQKLATDGRSYAIQTFAPQQTCQNLMDLYLDLLAERKQSHSK